MRPCCIAIDDLRDCAGQVGRLTVLVLGMPLVNSQGDFGPGEAITLDYSGRQFQLLLHEFFPMALIRKPFDARQKFSQSQRLIGYRLPSIRVAVQSAESIIKVSDNGRTFAIGKLAASRK